MARRISVDLPQPLAPVHSTSSPGRTENEISETAGRVWNGYV